MVRDPVGASPSGKAPDFDSGIRRFESSRPSQPARPHADATGRSFGWLTSVRSFRAKQRRLSSEGQRGVKEDWSIGKKLHYVYLLRSLSHPDERSVGFAANLKRRFESHNEGASIHTAKYRPWELMAYCAFKNERRTRAFEHYLNSGSGKAFANRGFGRSLTITPISSLTPIFSNLYNLFGQNGIRTTCGSPPTERPKAREQI
jgi:putative endonuclease